MYTVPRTVALLSKERENVRTAWDKDADRTNGGLQLRKSTLVLCLSRLAANVSGKAQRGERGEAKEDGVDKSS